jgi:threonine dehydrogenase-like Zn-dependent dehydrogenase
MTTMLTLEAPRRLVFHKEADADLQPSQVRLRTLFSGISAGTELSQYRGTSPFMHRRFDDQRRLFVESDTPSWPFPVTNLGYEEVGEIVEVGGDVDGLSVGQHVFGTWNHRTHHVATAAYARDRLMPPGADPRIGIFSHIGAVALNGVHDAGLRIGDTVAVWGLGVPGQIVCQAARASGARVIAVDPDPERRRIASAHGAAVALDPSDGGAAEAIKDLTGGIGADACIEVSGAAPALSDAVRAVAYSSRVVAMGFFQGEVAGLRLGEEFHHNRVALVCSQISGTAPEASHRWNKPRLWRTAVELQHAGTLDLLPLITDVVPFAEAPALFERLDQAEAGIMQTMLEFGS